MNRDEAEARLTSFQEQLGKAALRGKPEYDRLFDNPPPGLGAHEIDAGKKFVRVNAEELRLLGYAASELLGRPVFDFIVMSEVSQRAIDKKLTGSVEIKHFVRAFRKRDGSAVTMLLLDRHLKNAKGEIVGICSVMTPVATAAGADHK
jgi:PAS domain S-box-containing protein